MIALDFSMVHNLVFYYNYFRGMIALHFSMVDNPVFNSIKFNGDESVLKWLLSYVASLR